MNARLRMLKGLCLTVMFVCLMACSGKKDNLEDAGKPLPLEKIEAKVKLVKQWDRNITAGQGKDYNRLSLGLFDDGVCAAGIKGRVSCFSYSGAKLWTQNLKERLSGGVGIANDLVLVATSNGIVVALNLSDGVQRWKYNVNSLVLSSPQGNDDIVVVQSNDGRVIGLDIENGKKVWEVANDEPLLTLRGTATPVIDGGVAYTGFASGKVIAVNVSDGVVLWGQPVAIASGESEIERIVDVDASPKITNNAVYAASFNGNLYAFSKRDGRPTWRYETSTYREVDAGLGKVYLADEKSRLIAIDVDDGSQRWEQPQLLNRDLSAPVVFSGYMLVADYKGFVHILSQVDGAIVGRKRVDSSGVRVPMRVSDGQLFIYSNDGKLSSYKLKTLD